MIEPAIHAVSLLQFAPFLAKRDIDVLGFFGRRGFAPNIFQRHADWIPRDLCLDLANALVTETSEAIEARGDSEAAAHAAFSSSATHSMCGVWGNMSTGFTRRSL